MSLGIKLEPELLLIAARRSDALEPLTFRALMRPRRSVRVGLLTGLLNDVVVVTDVPAFSFISSSKGEMLAVEAAEPPRLARRSRASARAAWSNATGKGAWGFIRHDTVLFLITLCVGARDTNP